MHTGAQPHPPHKEQVTLASREVRAACEEPRGLAQSDQTLRREQHDNATFCCAGEVEERGWVVKGERGRVVEGVKGGSEGDRERVGERGRVVEGERRWVVKGDRGRVVRGG